MPKSKDAFQARRIAFMMKEFMNGRSYTTQEIHQVLSEDNPELTIRTIQRDLRVLEDCISGLVKEKEGKRQVWKIRREERYRGNRMVISTNELLSFHILKAHLKTFSGTVIAEEMKALTKKLEDVAPGEVYLEESMYWDQNIGQYDYTQSDPQLRRAIKFIAERKWVKIQYESAGNTKEYIALLRKMFTYSGMLYAVAYIPKHDSHVALALHNIESIEPQEDHRQKIPPFDFADWTRHRFGVFYGDVKKVVLKINKDMDHYFKNRHWHKTQKNSYDREGNLMLEMRVPLVADFIAWLMGWGDIITVMEPPDLIDMVKDKLKQSLSKYEKSGNVKLKE